MKKKPRYEDPRMGSLDLSGLTEHVVIDHEKLKKHREERERVIAEYKRKYGEEEGFRRWSRDTSNMPDGTYDFEMKIINTDIIWYGGPILDFHRKAYQRMHELYGDQYDALIQHREKDPRVTELLIVDAIKTGKWKELPDELQVEYHKRVGDMV